LYYVSLTNQGMPQLRLELLEVNVCPPTITNVGCKRKIIAAIEEGLKYADTESSYSTLMHTTNIFCILKPTILRSRLVGWSIRVAR
jgi:hypothetical protein